ncbi:hypothetical protein MSB_A0374 [Mycoplasma leachii PG50]|uniref:Uncharacterized protein n=1 Tax=Mycoplasma leachii (strain DSM 21131 / NCTC 10133 / N29 / PG50) TaxID=880447 RepID=E4PTZ3_MYCLG|nr:hypothetical protein MSB_A0374 [Mycoplasma leachii PG50]
MFLFLISLNWTFNWSAKINSLANKLTVEWAFVIELLFFNKK